MLYNGTFMLSDDGQIYITTDPVTASSVYRGGLAFDATGKLHVTSAKSASDVYVAGRRVTTTGALVVDDGALIQRPYNYVAGLPFRRFDYAMVRQIGQAPAASDPYVAGVRVGTLGGVYMQTSEPPIPPIIITIPVLTQVGIVGTVSTFVPSTADSGSITATQWTIDGANISGATGSTYTPVSGDTGKLLAVKQTWTNGAGSTVTTSASRLVIPAISAAVSHRYIDSTLGADDGGPYAEGAAYTPSFPLYDGTTAPAGTIHSTCALAYAATTGNGHRFYCRRGYFHDPSSGVFFTNFFTRSNSLFSSYGPTNAGVPYLDGIVYLTGSAGWTPNGTISGAWDYDLPGITTNNASLIGRLWVGRRKDGNLLNQRPIGIGRRRATTLSDLSLTNSGDNKGLWFITAGSPSKLTVMASVDSAPPVYWNGIGISFQNLTAGTPRGILMRNGASGNRVMGLNNQGCAFRPLGISELTTDSTCNNNAFVDVVSAGFPGTGVAVMGYTAARLVTNTYLSNAIVDSQSDALENDAGSNDFQNMDPFVLQGYATGIFAQGLAYTGHNVHTVIDTRNVGNIPVANVQINGLDIEFLVPTTDGRAWGGYVDGGWLLNFTVTNAATKTQIEGQNFEMAYGSFLGMQLNKDEDNGYACLTFNLLNQSPGFITDNFKVHDIIFDLSSAPPQTRNAIWFDGGSGSMPPVDAVEIYSVRAYLRDDQFFVCRASQATQPIPWNDQNIHDNVVVNENLIGNNSSTTDAGAKPPTYTTQPLNGFFGCVDNTVEQ